jgi:hypothetical protein
MDSMKLWARKGETVRQAIELGEIAHIETASEELTDEFLLFAIDSGLLKRWAESFPDPRGEPEMAMEVIFPPIERRALLACTRCAKPVTYCARHGY